MAGFIVYNPNYAIIGGSFHTVFPTPCLEVGIEIYSQPPFTLKKHKLYHSLHQILLSYSSHLILPFLLLLERWCITLL